MDTPTHRENPGGSPLGQPKGTGRQQAMMSWITVLTFCLLVVASVVAWFVQSSPAVVARKYLSAQGLAGDNLDLVGVEDHGFVPVFPFSKDATVEFRVKGADSPKKLEVKLSRTVYFLPWYATGFREKAEK